MTASVVQLADRKVQVTGASAAGAAVDVLTVRHVAKRFPPNILALEDASLSVRPGEVHCLLGANGAGKSTLLKIMAGAMRPSDGELLLEGRPLKLHSPSEGTAAGISMIYQELDLVPQLTVEQNLFLGHAPTRLGLVDRRTRREKAREALRRIGATFPPETRVERLSVANQQLTAIARSLTTDAKVIIMDEPSAALNEHELKNVFSVIRDLVRQGVSILYVSHRLNEIQEIGDRVTVLRGGRTIDTFDVAGTPEATLVEAVIGQNRSLVERAARRPVTGDVALRVHEMTGPEGLDIRDFELRWGEVIGLSGLNGSGRTTFLKALFGDVPFSGHVELEGRPLKPKSPAEAIRLGLGLVPENRKTEGLILDAPIYRNATLPFLRRSRTVSHRRLKETAEPVLRSLSTKYKSSERAVRELSGGNQQKVVLARWIIDRSRVLLLDEPSRGLDVGAKADLYALVRKLADEGAAVIVASSELEELYAACDAIWVFHEGRNVERFDPSIDNRDTILKASILGGRA
ncbi:monosaccharide ABC transporter ATP-binding protein, CUT2 family [Faunimonas pinastri]|uniref:Monosaccharide ABC transporter ATP-binding protein, CUT2 family n=1 Tax=Faunimonas pinastri TaxID=1855383 RepID=A0A1H9EVI2_9HYPH|nr:sugar ABC transporter ATP-binding protein [Faunimonas pinastri]SEQ29008.1 monosaccharide ABC transporter ATP-binding protein, CUT2 family [Faunimonas pinastri]